MGKWALSPQTRINTGFLRYFVLFPLNRAWGLAGNVVDYSVDAGDFVYDAAGEGAH